MSKEVNFKSIYFVKILRKKLWCRGKGGTVLHKCGCIPLFSTHEQVQAEPECLRKVLVLAHKAAPPAGRAAQHSRGVEGQGSGASISGKGRGHRLLNALTNEESQVIGGG